MIDTRLSHSTVDCGNARIRSHFRHLATVVTVKGTIDVDNLAPITEYSRRFVLAGDPLVLDLSEAKFLAAEAVSLLQVIADDCRLAGVDWIVVPSATVSSVLRDSGDDAAFPAAASVAGALHYFDDVIDRRRQLLLPGEEVGLKSRVKS